MGTTAYFYVGDFCTQAPNEIFPVLIPLTSGQTFYNNYVRTLDYGFPEISAELYQPVGGDGSWHAIVYNYGTGKWDDFYHAYTKPNVDPDIIYGWSLYETHYYPGPCSSVPNMVMTHIQVAVEPGGSDSNNYFRNAGLADIAFNTQNPNGANCFQNDGSGQGAVYSFEYLNPAYEWETTDPPAEPNCQVDSKGNCATLVNSTSNGVCDTGSVNVHGAPVFVTAYKYTYDVYVANKFNEVAMDVQTVPSAKPCTISSRWSPNEPRVAFGDPNLP